MNTVYAVVLRQSPLSDKKINTSRPYKIIESEKKTSQLLLRQFPDATLVFAPKRSLLSNGYDLCEEDFDDPLIPTGKSVKISPYVDAVNEILNARKYQSFAELEYELTNKYPNSETVQFIKATHDEINKKGLQGISGIQFDKGHLPVEVLIAKKCFYGGALEEIALEMNAIIEAVENSTPMTDSL